MTETLAPPNYYMTVDSKCGCVMEEGCRGSGGWHFLQTQHPITGSDQVTAYERCPAYWAQHGRTIDPHDRRHLLDLSKPQKGKGVKA